MTNLCKAVAQGLPVKMNALAMGPVVELVL